MKDKKVIVIGGNGHLGSAATAGALDAGANVTIVSRHARPDGKATAISASTADRDALAKILADASAVVVSVEADWTTPGMQAIYIEGMKNVIATVPQDAHVVFMGNIGVTDVARMAEYNTAKLTAEKELRESGLDYTIIRPSWIVSGHTGAKLEQGDKYTGRRDDVSHDQLANAFAAILGNREAASGKTFELYGASDDIVDWQEAIKVLVKD